MVRQLLPLPKKHCEVIVCDAHGGDSKGGHKSQEADRKHVSTFYGITCVMHYCHEGYRVRESCLSCIC